MDKIPELIEKIRCHFTNEIKSNKADMTEIQQQYSLKAFEYSVGMASFEALSDLLKSLEHR